MSNDINQHKYQSNSRFLLIYTCIPIAICTILLVLMIFRTAEKAKSQSSTLSPLADSYVSSGKKDQVSDRAYQMLVGYDADSIYKFEETQMLLRFQLPTTTTNKIESAKLTLYLTSTFTTQDSVSLNIKVQQIVGEWQEKSNPGLTWNLRQSFTVIVSPEATSDVPTANGLYTWDVTAVLQDWINKNRGTIVGLILTGDVSNVENKRSFFSKDCPNTDCGIPGSQEDKRPRLDITFSPPPPPPPPPPTATFTPTPGISFLTLRADPTGEIQRGQEITYSIGYQNGGYALSNVKIENVIPTQLVLITDSFSYSGQIPGTPTIVHGKITWDVASTLPISASGSVSYRAARPTLMPTNTVTVTPPLTDTPTVTITLTPTNTEVNAPTITHTPTPTNTPTATPTATKPPTGTVSATSTPIPTVPTSQVAVEVVAIPNDPQNFEFVGSLGSFTLDDAIPDDLDSITKRKTFDWKNSNVPIVITQKTLISWTLYSVVCYPPGNTSLQAAAQNSTLTLDAGILATNENLYCVFINVRNDYLGSPASQATANALIRSVSVGLQGTPVPTAVPTVEILEPIVNEGATIHWEYQATPDELTSNSTQNPSIQIYLPIIAR